MKPNEKLAKVRVGLINKGYKPKKDVYITDDLIKEIWHKNEQKDVSIFIAKDHLRRVLKVIVR